MHLRRTLFEPWDYGDHGFSSLRWDPLEDQRYALRWRDPSKSGANDGPGSMLGANSLALEALQAFPVIWTGREAETTGFHRNGRRSVFHLANLEREHRHGHRPFVTHAARAD